MIKSKKQHFCCIESKQLSFGAVEAREYFEAIRENETEYRITSEDGKKDFRATREELLSCGYLC
ncbi:MAG: hypothetical protein IKR68_02450 [Lachnospiraceae bacterium]|nr:hypothetical protein [Lachnospiraceae bacterium]